MEVECSTAFVGSLRMDHAISQKRLIAPPNGQQKAPFLSHHTRERGAVKLYSAQEKLRSAVLSEVLNGTDHLRGVGVLVVVPRHDLNLVGVVAATLNFCTFPSSSSQFRNNSYSTRTYRCRTKPVCLYYDYITFQRHLQGFDSFRF